MPQCQSGRSQKSDQEITHLHSPPDAIFANNDMLAMGSYDGDKGKGAEHTG